MAWSTPSSVFILPSDLLLLEMENKRWFWAGFSADSRLAYYFYLSVLWESLISTAWFMLLGLFDFSTGKRDDRSDRFFWWIILVPDIINLISYGILFWQLFKYLLEGHIHVSSEVNIPYIRRKGLGYSILWWGLVVYILSQGAAGLLYLFQIASFVGFNIELSIIIITVWAVFLLFLVIFNCKYSGQPYLNDEYKQKIRLLKIVVVIWSWLKIVRAGFGFNQKDNNFINQVLMGLSFKTNKWESMKFMIIFLGWDISPFLMILDTSLIKIFKLEARRSNSVITYEEGDTEQLLDGDNWYQMINRSNGNTSSFSNIAHEEDKEQGNAPHFKFI